MAEKRLIQEHLQSAIERIERLYSEELTVSGLATGFTDLDAATSGLQPGDLVIVAGRPSMGKSSFVFNVAESIACDFQKSVVMFSMEMDSTKLATKMCSSAGRINQFQLLSGEMQDEDWQSLINVLPRLNESPLYILDALSIDWNAAAISETLFKEGIEPSLILVDGIQSLDVASFTTAYDRNMQLYEQARQFKKMALQMNVPVILTAPLSRDVESRPNKRPVMRDLRDIGQLEDIADVILFIYRDEIYNPDTPDRGVAEILIGKHRSGPPCTVKLAFRSEYCRFDNLRIPEEEAAIDGWQQGLSFPKTKQGKQSSRAK